MLSYLPSLSPGLLAVVYNDQMNESIICQQGGLEVGFRLILDESLKPVILFRVEIG